MSQSITLEFPDGTRIHTTTNPQLSQYEDYYHNGKWYNISELKEVHEEEKSVHQQILDMRPKGFLG